jgi:hypothetical protein
MLALAIITTVVVGLQYIGSMMSHRGNGVIDVLVYHAEIALIVTTVWVLYSRIP